VAAWASDRQTNRQTDRSQHRLMPHTDVGGNVKSTDFKRQLKTERKPLKDYAK